MSRKLMGRSMCFDALYVYNPKIDGRMDDLATVTTEHSASSYGVPVLLIRGKVFGSADVPPGSCLLSPAQDRSFGKVIRAAGYSTWSAAQDDTYRG